MSIRDLLRHLPIERFRNPPPVVAVLRLNGVIGMRGRRGLSLAGKAGEITLYPLWPGPGKPAKRVIVRARKQIANPTRLLPGMILHEDDGTYTAAADAVLRGAAGLDM